MLQPAFQGRTTPGWIRRKLADGLTSVLLFGHNFAAGPDRHTKAAALIAHLRKVNPDVLVAVDEEDGDVTRLDGRPAPRSRAI
ncbi:hypothetical protein [Kitasatospora paranensis]|uniref:Uncharacterized protein n=1 Tax=Kitasatospora paranensis TaxID=258053 RepID=A0ABW2G346_9ACTN